MLVNVKYPNRPVIESSLGDNVQYQEKVLFQWRLKLFIRSITNPWLGKWASTLSPVRDLQGRSKTRLARGQKSSLWQDVILQGFHLNGYTIEFCTKIALCTITKNRFCHFRFPAWLRQTLHSTHRLCMSNMRFGHENCS